MDQALTFESLLPALITLTAALAGLWAVLWIMTRAIELAAERTQDARRLHGMKALSRQLVRLLRRATGAATLLVSVLIMLHGVGVTGFPQLSWPGVAAWIRATALPVLFIVGSAFVLLRTAHLIAGRLPDLVSADGPPAETIERRKRAASAGRLLRWASTAGIGAIGLLMTLHQLGVDLTPILAGGAVLSVSIGFGAQNLVRDVVAGISLIVENQVRVGDIATINGKGGLVESVGLRVTALRGLDGTVHIFPNGAITELSNSTKDFSYYVIDVGVAYRENVDHVMDVLRDIGRSLETDPAFTKKILAPLEVLGVDDFADSAVIIKIRIKSVPLEQWVVGRELRRRIKNRFDELGIEIPFPHLSLHAGSEGKPFGVALMQAPADS